MEDCLKRPNDELCTRVESLLKGMLLPAPEKHYKDLIDVDVVLPEELREKVPKNPNRSPCKSKQPIPIKNDRKKPEPTLCLSESPVSSLRDESVSPELKEQEIWYTQPIDVVFHSQDDDEVSNSKLRLYKRNSYPSFSPEAEMDEEAESCHTQSSASSPVFERRRSLSQSSDNSDDILVGSVLIPAWLTEVISADEHSDDNGEDIDLSTSLKSSSPFPSNSLPKSEDPVCLIGDEAKEKYGAAWIKDELSQPSKDDMKAFFQEPGKHPDDCSTPTPVVTPGSEHQRQHSDSVSLVDLDYIARFLCEETPEWNNLSPDEDFTLPSPRRPGISTLWQCQILFDITSDMAESLPEFFSTDNDACDLQCWQPIGSSPYSQLWDVNMQKRSKVSSWGMPHLSSDNPVWFTENTFLFMRVSDGKEDEFSDKNSENTLIPQISIDLSAEVGTDPPVFKEADIDIDCCQPYQYFDRSVSMGDVPSLWNDETPKKSNPQLSRSFELIPSEHSAFCDVPRKLSHVHSEPNLVQFRQEFASHSEDLSQSPQEHLYYSPKTHFRPITPAYASEHFTPKSKQQVCNDLFGGLPSTKTPYQQYHGTANKNQEDEAFIPSFKVKNYSKSIQTGESIDNGEELVDSSDSEERDTPETLTLSILEDIMNENDKEEKLVTIMEDLDTANTDSAYETDYGGNAGLDNEAERASRASGCVRNKSMYQSQGYSECEAVDHGHLGEVVDFSVESFMATFPHTQDWPDGACHLLPAVENTWRDIVDDEFPTTSWCPFDPNNPAENPEAPPPFPVPASGLWGEDLSADHLYDEMEKYKNIWSTAGHDLYTMDVGPQAECGIFGLVDCNDEVYDNVPQEDDVFTNVYPHTPEEQAVNEIEEYDNVPVTDKDQLAGMKLPGSREVDSPGYAGFPDNSELVEPTVGSLTEPGNYFSVKLVYKDKQKDDGGKEDSKVFAIYNKKF